MASKSVSLLYYIVQTAVNVPGGVMKTIDALGFARRESGPPGVPVGAGIALGPQKAFKSKGLPLDSWESGTS